MKTNLSLCACVSVVSVSEWVLSKESHERDEMRMETIWRENKNIAWHTERQ